MRRLYPNGTVAPASAFDGKKVSFCSPCSSCSCLSLIALSVAAPQVAVELRRDQETETNTPGYAVRPEQVCTSTEFGDIRAPIDSS